MVKKILVVSNIFPSENSPHEGTFVANIVSMLEQSFDVTLCTLDRRLPKFLGYFLFYVLTVVKIFRDPSRLVYVHFCSHSSPPVLFAQKFFRDLKVVTHVHGGDILCEEGVSKGLCRFKKFVSSVALRKSDRVVVPSQYFRRVVSDKYGANIRTFVSPSGGVDLLLFRPKRIELERRRKEFHVGFVGRLTKDKGIFDFLWLLERSELCALKYFISGTGPEMQHVRDRVHAKANVFILGPVKQTELADHYNNLDILIFPTLRSSESLGLVGLESMACGVPVLAYGIGGPAEYIETGTNGFLAKAGDRNSLLEALLTFISLSSQDRKLISKEALKTAARYDRGLVSKLLVEELMKL